MTDFIHVYALLLTALYELSVDAIYPCSLLRDRDSYLVEHRLITTVLSAGHGNRWHCAILLQRRPSYPWTYKANSKDVGPEVEFRHLGF